MNSCTHYNCFTGDKITKIGEKDVTHKYDKGVVEVTPHIEYMKTDELGHAVIFLKPLYVFNMTYELLPYKFIP